MSRKHRIIAIVLAGAAAMAAVMIYAKFEERKFLSEGKVVIEEQDLAPANLGQLRYFTSQAAKYLDWKLKDLGGAGPKILEILDNLKKNKAFGPTPITLGQLEEAAKPFYDRLIAIGFNTTTDIKDRIGGDVTWTSSYPWNPLKSDAASNTTAQVGQLKFVFGFDLIKFQITDEISTRKDGLPDKWIVAHGLDPFDSYVASEDPDGDELSNLDEYRANTDPHNPDTDGDGVPDGMDAVPFDARFQFASQGVPQYATIDLGPGETVDTNEDYAVLIRNPATNGNVTTMAYHIWYQGTTSAVPSIDGKGNSYQWLTIGVNKLISGIMVSKDGKTARPARWKPGDASPTVLTADQVLFAMPDVDFQQPYGEVPVGPDHIYFGPEGIFYEAVYYLETGKVRYEEARLLLWDNRNRLRVMGDEFGNGPGDIPKTPPKQSILLASAPDTNLVYEMTGSTVPENGTGWRTTSITAQLLLNGKVVPGSEMVIERPDMVANLSLADLPQWSDAQNLTHPVIPDFFGNHTLYMDPGGNAALVAVDWPAAPEGKGVVKFKSLNASGVGITTDGKQWINGIIHDMSGLLSESDSKKFKMHVNKMDGDNGVVSGSIHFYSDDHAIANTTSRVAGPAQAATKKFDGVIPLTSSAPRCAPTYPAATKSVLPEMPGNRPKASRRAK
jgi:hypothetical protein